MKYNPVSRRMFLQGLGGTLAIPLLPSLLPKAHADTAPPLRYVMTLGMLGRDITRWYPDIPDSAMNATNGALYKSLNEIPGSISYILGPDFDSLKGKVNVLRGLDSLQSQGHNSWVPTTGCGGDPSSAEAFGYSIDCVLEESRKFYTQAPAIGVIRSVASTNEGGRYGDFASWSYTSKSVYGQKIAAEWSPMNVYNALFNPSTIATKAEQAGRIVTATNAVYENFKSTIQNRRIATADKYKLDAYMQQLSEIDTRLKNVPKACSLASAPGNAQNNEQLHAAMIDLEVAALACGLTKVVMHSITHWESSLALSSDYHSAAHAGGQLVQSLGTSQASIFNRYMMGRVADFMKKLDSVQESNGTLLDNTLFVYANEDSTGSHDHKDLPVLVAGAKSKLRAGYYIDYRPRPLVLPTQYSATMLGRPYNQLLVTAFQALGLSPADYQKFGAVGFGRYDNINPSIAQYYQPFLGSNVNNPLPFLYI